MSILIKDMKMPERCLECPFYDNYNYYCILYSFGIPARYNRDGSTRPEWCEIKELPERTGRWIFGHTLGHSWMKCSECLVSQDGQTACFSYCPNCGARMVKESEEYD